MPPKTSIDRMWDMDHRPYAVFHLMQRHISLNDARLRTHQERQCRAAGQGNCERWRDLSIVPVVASHRCRLWRARSAGADTHKFDVDLEVQDIVRSGSAGLRERERRGLMLWVAQ